VQTVFVGLSGGVDSSVAALLLKQQGYHVVGVHMRNWTKSLPGFDCPWREDYLDAKRIAVQLGIEFMLFDFEQEYFDRVVEYMLDGFRSGITPNPDIMCNQEIKFKLFLDMAIDKGADFIATGHYARVGKRQKAKGNRLMIAADGNKDQTYFLYRITEQALSKTLFPLGSLTKSQVREIAKANNLITASKKESMGICFVGKVGIKDFLKNFVTTEPGPIKEQNGIIVGQHEGAIFYTIGQRHGLNVGGGLPYYVTAKDMITNTVFVTNDIQDPDLWTDRISTTSAHWINKDQPISGDLLRSRHRGELYTISSYNGTDILLTQKIRAVTPGQSVVIYRGDTCIGGAIIC
jgi:tRNA-uridine 2-sulfurtransferase